MTEEQAEYGKEEMPQAELPALKAPVDLSTGKAGRGGLVPTNLQELWQLAVIISKSKMAPEKMQDPATLAVAIQMGMEVGMNPMQAVQNIAVINGRPSIWGDIGLALVMASGLLEDFEETITEEDGIVTATCTAKRKGIKSPFVRTFDSHDAQRAGLNKKPGPWQQYKKRMTQMRARWWTLRDGFADVLKGLQAAEESIDITPLGNGSHGVPNDKEVQKKAADLTEQIKNGAPGPAPVVKYEAEDIPPATTVDPGAAQDLVDKLDAGDHEISGYGATDLTQGGPHPDNGGTKNGWYGDLLKARPGASDKARESFGQTVRDNLLAIHLLPNDQLRRIKAKWSAVFEDGFPVVASDDDSDQEPEELEHHPYSNFVTNVLRSQKRAVDQKRTGEFWELMGNLGYDSDTWRDALEDDREEMVKALQKRFGG